MAAPVPLDASDMAAPEVVLAHARAFRRSTATRRTDRDFAERDVSRAVIEEATAALAPSGANQQPLHFAAIGRGPLCRRLQAAEAEKHAFNGIALGFLLCALHRAGLATLTRTLQPMALLNELRGRPAIEKPYVLLAVGYPAAGCRVPAAAGINEPFAEVTSGR